MFALIATASVWDRPENINPSPILAARSYAARETDCLARVRARQSDAISSALINTRRIRPPGAGAWDRNITSARTIWSPGPSDEEALRS